MATGAKALAEHEPVRVGDEGLADHLVADSFVRFKGLERPAIVIVDLELVTEGPGRRMYLAMTRAQTTARVIAPREVLRSNPVQGCCA